MKANQHKSTQLYWFKVWNGRLEGPSALRELQEKFGGSIMIDGGCNVLVSAIEHDSVREEWDDKGRDLTLRVLKAVWAASNEGTVAIAFGEL